MLKALPEPPKQVWVAMDSKTVLTNRNAKCCNLRDKIEKICPVNEASVGRHVTRAEMAKEPATKTQLSLPEVGGMNEKIPVNAKANEGCENNARIRCRLPPSGAKDEHMKKRRGSPTHSTKVPEMTLMDASVNCYAIKGRDRADCKKKKPELSNHSTKVPETTGRLGDLQAIGES